jgi:hypothetical protein
MKKLLLIFLFISSFLSAADYLMLSESDCGPAALHAVTDIPREQIIKAMKWSEKNPNVTDNPAAHFAALKTLKIPYQNRSVTALLNNTCKPNKTMILIHANDSPYLAQHWVVLASEVSEDGAWVHWGNGTMRHFSKDQLVKLITQGGPTNTIYEVGVGGSRPKPWFMLVFRIVSKLFGGR